MKEKVGFGSKIVITGDLTQKDLPKGAVSGLETAVKILDNIEGIRISKLTNRDVVRHPLVQRIVKAYEEYELKNDNRNDRPRDKRRK